MKFLSHQCHLFPLLFSHLLTSFSSLSVIHKRYQHDPNICKFCKCVKHTTGKLTISVPQFFTTFSLKERPCQTLMLKCSMTDNPWFSIYLSEHYFIFYPFSCHFTLQSPHPLQSSLSVIRRYSAMGPLAPSLSSALPLPLFLFNTYGSLPPNTVSIS